ncbi:hypothetical protein [Nocardioides sp. Leaf285]|nr:hypothetical protein [Nocardioides sp. Leaf285]
MSLVCDSCRHDWHGMTCTHSAVVRNGWWLQREECRCTGEPGAGVTRD